MQISVILSALTFCWLLLLPASLRGIHGSWHTPDIPWECWIVPASLMYDPLFGVLAFGAGAVRLASSKTLQAGILVFT